jgi:hypothetical protein
MSFLCEEGVLEHGDDRWKRIFLLVVGKEKEGFARWRGMTDRLDG